MQELTLKEQRFVQAYLQSWNASAAARESGFKGTATGSRVAGTRIMARPHVQAAIAEAMAKDAMPAEEVIDRLTQQARLNAMDFYTFKDGAEPEINWDMVKRYGYLINKIIYTNLGKPRLEFHDSQRALELIGKAHQLFVDRTDMNVNMDGLTVKVIKGVSVDEL